jgi:hypothetical protein
MAKFRTQADLHLRTMSYANLLAMCGHASGMAHTYSAELRKTVCELTYSNPDEYGNANPYTVRLPLLRNSFEPENPWIVFHVQSEFGAGDEHDKESAFQTIESEIFIAPMLWRDPNDSEWKTRRTVLREQGKPAEPWEDMNPTEARFAVRDLIEAMRGVFRDASLSGNPYMRPGSKPAGELLCRIYGVPDDVGNRCELLSPSVKTGESV